MGLYVYDTVMLSNHNSHVKCDTSVCGWRLHINNYWIEGYVRKCRLDKCRLSKTQGPRWDWQRDLNRLRIWAIYASGVPYAKLMYEGSVKISYQVSHQERALSEPDPLLDGCMAMSHLARGQRSGASFLHMTGGCIPLFYYSSPFVRQLLTQISIHLDQFPG